MNINDTLQYLNIGLPDDIARRKAWGDFEGAIRLIDLRLAQDNLSEPMRACLTAEREIICRIPQNYPFDRAAALAVVRGHIPNFTEEEFDERVDAGKISWLYVNGEMHFLDRFFETVFAADLPIAISVKTRLGLREEDEFPRILAIYNRYPIAELTLHPRVQKDFYQKPIHEAAFARALPDCRLPLCYNGELRTAAQVADFHEKYPTVDRLMFGRGIVADPALPRKLQGGEAASLEEIRRFTAALYEGYQAAYGSRGPAVQKMKELWFRLIGLFDEHERCEKRMRRLRSPDDYEAAEAEIFASCPLRTETGDFKP